MQEAEVVLSVLRERGRKGLPCEQLYRQMFNRDLYLLAYGNIYSNQGAMTPGAGGETADGMSEEKIEQITGLIRRESYRFSPARRSWVRMNSQSRGSSSGWLRSAAATPHVALVSSTRCSAWPAFTQSTGRSLVVVSMQTTPADRDPVPPTM